MPVGVPGGGVFSLLSPLSAAMRSSVALLFFLSGGATPMALLGFGGAFLVMDDTSSTGDWLLSVGCRHTFASAGQGMLPCSSVRTRPHR